MNKKWKIKDSADPQIAEQLSIDLGIDFGISDILVQRGIKTFEEARTFFRPSLNSLHDPFLMIDMDQAVGRIEKALDDKEKILVYGDYDVDGTTAVALVFTFLKSLHPHIDYYIPDRYTEGYGITFKGIDWARDNGYSLIIALDCGIKSIEEIDYASKQKIDFIICDHHRPGSSIPKAIAVLDPQRSDCFYPFKELSGCGLGLKLIQAYLTKNNLPLELLESFLDLVVVSIASDMVPVTGENRILAFHGLKRINSTARPGFKAMLELANVKHEITINDLIFIIGPRINAAGRLESGKKAVELLISEDSPSALISGQNINITNSLRRDLDVKITEQAMKMIMGDSSSLEKKTTVLYHREWHKGVVGIVASRLIEKYYRPTIVLTESNGMATGSARSVKNFDIYKAIEACSPLLERFGGHKYAAGLSLKLENLETFRTRFEAEVAATIEESSLIPEIEIDGLLEPAAITQKFLRILKQLGPFGPGNPVPIFLSENVLDSGKICIVGNNHLRMDLFAQNNTRTVIPAIAFGMGHLFGDIYKGKPFNICYSIEETEWKGNVSIQLNVKDIKIK